MHQIILSPNQECTTTSFTALLRSPTITTVVLDLLVNQGFDFTNIPEDLNDLNCTHCPLGWTCDTKPSVASCVDLQKKYRDKFLLGNIISGAYCPQELCFLENCPLGYYCRYAETLNTYPKGYFCTHKVSTEQILFYLRERGTILQHQLIPLRILYIYLVYFSLCFTYIHNLSILHRQKYQQYDAFDALQEAKCSCAIGLAL